MWRFGVTSFGIVYVTCFQDIVPHEPCISLIDHLKWKKKGDQLRFKIKYLLYDEKCLMYLLKKTSFKQRGAFILN